MAFSIYDPFYTHNRIHNLKPNPFFSAHFLFISSSEHQHFVT